MIEAPKIRFAKQSDLEDIISLCNQHAIYEQSDYSPTNKKEQLDSHLFTETPSLFCLVAEQGNSIIGYATYMKQFSTWDAEFYLYMDCLFLNEESRGLGIGEALINQIKREAQKLHCNHIQWQTPDFNTRAIKFYQRIGATSKSKERFFLPV